VGIWRVLKEPCVLSFVVLEPLEQARWIFRKKCVTISKVQGEVSQDWREGAMGGNPSRDERL